MTPTYPTMQALADVLRPFLPNATLFIDTTGEITISTGLKQVGWLVPMDAVTPTKMSSDGGYDEDSPFNKWQPEGYATRIDFYEVRVHFDRSFEDDEQAHRLFGCIAYAFKEHLRGEAMGQPQWNEDATAFTASYDITKSRSDDWTQHWDACMDDVRIYAQYGTPERRNKTRLIEGLGFNPITSVEVR